MPKGKRNKCIDARCPQDALVLRFQVSQHVAGPKPFEKVKRVKIAATVLIAEVKPVSSE